MHNSINRKGENHLIFIGKHLFAFFAGFWVDERTEPGSKCFQAFGWANVSKFLVGQMFQSFWLDKRFQVFGYTHVSKFLVR